MQLAHLHQLKHLVLSGTGVTDAGLAALGGLPDLTYLVVADTAVTEAGVRALQQSRPLLKVHR
jgi:hypothetical protein